MRCMGIPRGYAARCALISAKSFEKYYGSINMGLIESLTNWKQNAQQKIIQWSAGFQAGATDAIYASLLSVGLFPLLEALQTGMMDFAAVEQVLSAIGCSLLAGEVKIWY